ncbi:hypothetical protein [Chryseolinea lacunae]|uniref:Uncharacterized protein n=1 Tax=Chryseolinea lacunae TaxID=2801331 RepID=A0ABS1L310_9BACT|nr:hypothetical protein [Chryseolinea lacunae]MBL0744936.1 hypothetical protein [Chryseolinea lacunae]
MKKLIYIALVAISSAMTFVSCTEEEVKPSTEFGPGGLPSDPKTNA